MKREQYKKAKIMFIQAENKFNLNDYMQQTHNAHTPQSEQKAVKKITPRIAYKNNVVNLLYLVNSFKVAIIIILIVYNFLINKVSIITQTIQKTRRAIRFHML